MKNDTPAPAMGGLLMSREPSPHLRYSSLELALDGAKAAAILLTHCSKPRSIAEDVSSTVGRSKDDTLSLPSAVQYMMCAAEGRHPTHAWRHGCLTTGEIPSSTICTELVFTLFQSDRNTVSPVRKSHPPDWSRGTRPEDPRCVCSRGLHIRYE